MQLDVSGVQPEAQRTVERVARIFVTHLGQSLVSLIAHGSAVKGGYIPRGSDIDLKLIVTPPVLDDIGALPLDIAIQIHRDLAVIDPAPFRYLQARVHRVGARTEAGFIRGAYHVVYGDEELPLATDEELRQNAHVALSGLNPVVISARASNHLLDHGEDRLFRELRLLCTAIWPTLYHVVSLIDNDAVATWSLTKSAAIARTNPETDVGQSIRTFYSTVVAHYRDGEAVETALESVASGVAFLHLTASWYQSMSVLGHASSQ